MHLGALKLHLTGPAIQGSFICGPAGGGKNDVNCPKGNVVDHFTIASSTATVAPSATVAPMVTVAPMATAAPDVIVTSLSYVKGIFTSTVKNQGTAATPAGVVVGVKYSVDGSGKTWGSVNGLLAKAPPSLLAPMAEPTLFRMASTRLWLTSMPKTVLRSQLKPIKKCQ